MRLAIRLWLGGVVASLWLALVAVFRPALFRQFLKDAIHGECQRMADAHMPVYDDPK